MLDQLGRFLAAGDVRRAVRERVDRVLGPDTELVVAHSLGTLVSYQVLAARPELSPALVTMGSPLDPLRLRPAAAAARRRRRRVARLGPLLDQRRGGGRPGLRRSGSSGKFGDRVVDHTVDNGHRAHDPEPYLNATLTGGRRSPTRSACADRSGSLRVEELDEPVDEALVVDLVALVALGAVGDDDELEPGRRSRPRRSCPGPARLTGAASRSLSPCIASIGAEFASTWVCTEPSSKARVQSPRQPV